MKVISLLQPWATLVVIGAKKIETRSWNTKYRGELLIHASAKRIRLDDGMYDLIDHMTRIGFMNDYDKLPYGAVIGKVNLKDICPTETICAFTQWGYGEDKVVLTEQEKAFGDYSQNRFAWWLTDPVQFNKITPLKGSLSLWNFNERICLKCGCTENNACISPMFGPCWWTSKEKDLCSHCIEGVEDVKP